jgi:hypothetical protein
MQARCLLLAKSHSARHYENSKGDKFCFHQSTTPLAST